MQIMEMGFERDQVFVFASSTKQAFGMLKMSDFLSSVSGYEGDASGFQ